MLEALRPGGAAAELRSPSAIELLDAGTTAFVGRCLRGPINEPTLVRSNAEFQQIFGGLWQPSMLSYAVEQFFGQGGQYALIVRVANGAQANSITLPAGGGAIRLKGRVPGTREYLRAAVDYDGISDPHRFNLVVQRLRAPATEQIEFQETFRQVSWRTEDSRSLTAALAGSALVQLLDCTGDSRPQPTWHASAGGHDAYVAANADGDDGARLSDHDLIGCSETLTGMQALRFAAADFRMLCLPPLDRDRDVGLPALLVAARICRERQAMLLIDPPAAWDNAAAALAGLDHWALHAPEACMFFPRVQVHDRARGRDEGFSNGGAVAGLLARAGVAGAGAGHAVLRAPLLPRHAVSEQDERLLARRGVNVLHAAAAPVGAAVTLVTELQGRRGRRELAARRQEMLLAASIERGTRWALTARPGAALWHSLREQVEALLAAARLGAYFVVCDARLNPPDRPAAGAISLLYGIELERPGDYQSWLVTHRPAGSSVREVSARVPGEFCVAPGAL